jgi:two-component system, OmpR family, phosphate regulon sensor histidine kinase PhoR
MSSLDVLFLLVSLALSGVIVVLIVSLNRARAQALAAYAGRAEAVAVRSAMEARLERDRESLDALGESTSDALVLLDENRQVAWANVAAWEFFNGGQPAVGRSFIALVRDHELNQALADALTGNRAMMRQAAVGERMLRIWATPIEGSDGAAVGVEDVTELQRLGRARRDFVANISHELRTPLANIDLAAQTLRNAGEGDPALTHRMLDQIQVQVRMLSQLSQEMMELAQIESGQVLLKLESTELEPVIRHTVTNLMPQAAMKNQQLSLHVPEGLTALIDEAMIGRVINNLIHNAIKFAPDGGIVTVTAEAKGEDVEICVADNGPGIPKEEQRRVFERFYKADRARSRGGTGLGLAIARHMVEGHGGQIWVDSTPGHGATFCFTVPRA